MDFIRNHEDFRRNFQNFIECRCPTSQLGFLQRLIKKLKFVYAKGAGQLFEVSSFLNQNAHTSFIGSCNQTFAQYFQEKHNYNLQYPNAHLVAIKKGGKTISYPAELLTVADNQTCTVEQMSAKDKAEMIKRCALRSDFKVANTKCGAEAIQLHNNEHVKNVGLAFSKNVIKVPARQLPLPSFEYVNNRISKTERGESSWKQLPFIRGAKIEGYSCYLIGAQNDQQPAVSEYDISAFLTSLERTAKQFGMDLGKCLDKGWIFDNDVYDRVRLNKDNNCKMVFFISPDSIKKAHDYMKNAEHLSLEVVTQDIKSNTVRKVIQRGAATLENIIGKTNQKLGGLNYSVKVDIPEIQEHLENTLFIGISSSQPGSKTRVDKAQAVKGNRNEKPGVLGYCANICQDKDTFAGDFMYINAYRSEIYQCLQEVSRRCVAYFTESRGRQPKNVIWYYAGVSEGQYDNILKYSVPIIRRGIEQATNGVSIPLCIMAVQKVTNVKIMPRDEDFPRGAHTYRPGPSDNPHSREARDSECLKFNVPAGTVVDSRLTNPIYAEFYLVSHSSPIGTARNPRYTILVNEPNYNADEIQVITNALCYETQIVSKATALPTPVQVAEDYANRGRHVFLAA